MRLLDLPEAVQALVGDGSLAMGHARALIGASDAEEIARKVVREGLSVRAVEALVRAEKGGGRKGRLEYKSIDGGRDPDIVAVERHRRSEEHTSELQSLMRIPYAAFCLKKKK